MDSKLFQLNQAFLNLFEVEQDYYDLISWENTKYGFSVKRQYPNNIKYKPVIKNNGKPDNVALLSVVLNEEKKCKDGEISLTVNISNFNLWQGHFPDETNLESPMKASIEASKKTPKPASLEYLDDFFYDSNKRIFLDKQKNIITGKQILDQVFREHCDTVYPIRGLKYKIKPFVLNKFITILNNFCLFLKFMIEKMFQRKLIPKEEYLKDSLLDTFLSISDTPEKQLSIFGHYKTHESTGLIFCIIAMLLSFVGYCGTIRLEYARSLLKHEVLLIIHFILALMFIEALPNKVIFPMLNGIIKFRDKAMFVKMTPFSYKSWFCIIIFILSLAIITFSGQT